MVCDRTLACRPVASFYPLMRATVVLLVLLLWSARIDGAPSPDRQAPVARIVGADGVTYRGDRIELRLAPGASRVAAARTAGLARTDALGVGAVDRLSSRLGGVWFEPLFRGETPPPPGSDEIDFTSFYVAHLPPGVALADALDHFRGLAEVASADAIALLPVDAFPNDSLWAASPWYYQPGSRRDIRAPEAWDVTTGDTAIVVAVLDTGVLPTHPDLGGPDPGRPGQIWTNWVEAGGVPGVDAPDSPQVGHRHHAKACQHQRVEGPGQQDRWEARRRRLRPMRHDRGRPQQASRYQRGQHARHAQPARGTPGGSSEGVAHRPILAAALRLRQRRRAGTDAGRPASEAP